MSSIGKQRGEGSVRARTGCPVPGCAAAGWAAAAGPGSGDDGCTTAPGSATSSRMNFGPLAHEGPPLSRVSVACRPGQAHDPHPLRPARPRLGNVRAAGARYPPDHVLFFPSYRPARSRMPGRRAARGWRLSPRIISHGLAEARATLTAGPGSFEALLTEAGVTPATIRPSIDGGGRKAGLSDADLERIAMDESVIKVSSRDLALAMAGKADGQATDRRGPRRPWPPRPGIRVVRHRRPPRRGCTGASPVFPGTRSRRPHGAVPDGPSPVVRRGASSRSWTSRRPLERLETLGGSRVRRLPDETGFPRLLPEPTPARTLTGASTPRKRIRGGDGGPGTGSATRPRCW